MDAVDGTVEDAPDAVAPQPMKPESIVEPAPSNEVGVADLDVGDVGEETIAAVEASDLGGSDPGADKEAEADATDTKPPSDMDGVGLDNLPSMKCDPAQDVGCPCTNVGAICCINISTGLVCTAWTGTPKWTDLFDCCRDPAPECASANPTPEPPWCNGKIP